MNGYENNSVWDLKLLNAKKVVSTYKCCPNDTFPRIDYTFSLTRHSDINHRAYITPAIGKQLLAKTTCMVNLNQIFSSFDISHLNGVLVGFEIS